MKTAIPDLPFETSSLSSASAFRFDFPPQMLAEREQIVADILRLMTEDTPTAIREACRMHNAWMDKYPNDYVMLDLGSSLWMLADAIEATTGKVSAEEPALSLSR